MFEWNVQDNFYPDDYLKIEFERRIDDCGRRDMMRADQIITAYINIKIIDY